MSCMWRDGSFMKTVGIIAEFNPLHTGHEYLIRQLRKECGVEYCVVVMSGDYVQRGEPAFFSKFLRTRAALLSGADLVLELPLSVSTGSAEYFAEGAVSLLHRLGCVTHLGFGSESGDIHAFRSAGKLLSEEPEAYRRHLRRFLKEGMSFPRARYEALSHYINESDENAAADMQSASGASSTNPISQILSLLESPNNILGTEYCKALHRLHSSIVPVTVKRLGAGYHESVSQDVEYASASGLRKSFSSFPDTDQMESLLQDYVPRACRSLYLEALRQRQYLIFDDLFLPLYYTLQYTDVETLSRYQDVTPAFSERLLDIYCQCSSVTELIAALKTKNLTSSRISRSLLHILFRLTADAVAAEREQGFALYARILGFRRQAEPLLSEIKKHSSIPLVSKLADAKKNLSPSALAQLEQTIKASGLYRAAGHGTVPGSEYAQSIVIL